MGSDRRPSLMPQRNLLSDHFALEMTIPIGSTALANRKRLDVPTARLGQLTAYVEAWYSATRDTYTNADSLYGSLTDIIEDFVEGTRGPTQSKKPCQRTYARDLRIVNCQQTLATYQRQWQKNPGDHEAREAMVVVARHLTELRQEVRKIYWNDFLAKVRQTKSLQEVWQHVNQVRGKNRRPTCTPDPAAKAQELMHDWKGASSLSGLPRHHQEELANQRQRRRDLVHQNVILEDDTCVAITHDELLYAVKRGKSTAPGKDGLTYNVLNAIIAIKGNNPIVDLFNMSYNSGQLPTAWKNALIVPIPKGDGNFRPISLTSCLCKMMERVLLNRLLYKISSKLSSNLHGFMKGRSTSDCFIKCLANTPSKCRAFVDLKGAFDRANKDVIIEELIVKGIKGRLLEWICDYLYNRKAQVWFQGAVSSEETLDLGTPQGSVLSPMLFNTLMDKIARYEFPQGTQVIIYADDIVIQCETPRKLSSALEQLSSLCVQMGLVINEAKTKFQTSLRVCRAPRINGVPITRVPTYKYLGVQISHKKCVQTVTHVRDICLPRLAPLRVLANSGRGVGIPILRMFYISVIRSLIDYAAIVLVQFSMTQLRPIELIQNEAMRIILGCPRTAKIEVL
ncbi:hypothetical protein Pcinc_000864 [Petrolisthes cinctipes]|uniref:Reverse transcriptase domain-containing protein n=1 Tax=Petrolisthes cinctipes TaxID=88211 RepID=A0AAE1GP27_PETCI|nr:hypothetical protein Pcinc_000864 [Petrolisthes cinctipes]